MSLVDKLNQDLKESMKAGDANRTGVIRMLNASLKNKQIEKGRDEELNDEDITQVIIKEAKKRREAIDAFTKGNRPEMAQKEKEELAVLNAYLPKQMSREEVVTEVEKILADIEDKGNIGMVMKAVMAELKGKADGKMISEIVRTYLGNNS